MRIVKLIDSQQEGAATSRGNEFDDIPGHDLVANTNGNPALVSLSVYQLSVPGATQLPASTNCNTSIPTV
jgi:hypothetical protein